MALDVHEQSDHFRLGFIAGFYGVSNGDRLIDDILRRGAHTADDRELLAGYRYGRRLADGRTRRRLHTLSIPLAA